MKKSVLLAILFVVVVIGAVVYTSMSAGTNRYRVEVCIAFQGRQSCRAAGAATEQAALRTATENACAQIASGMTDSIQCANTTPSSTKWLSGK